MTLIARRKQTAGDCGPRQRRLTSFATSCRALVSVTAALTATQVHAFAAVRRSGGTTMPSEFGIGILHDSGLATSRTLSTTSTSSLGHKTKKFLSTRRSRPYTTTRLNFRDGDGDDSQRRQQEHRQAADKFHWWQSMFRPAALEPEDRDQQSVDEYLEFLNRRYKRLHDDDSKQSSGTTKKFSALSWLKAGDNGEESTVITPQQQEDALYVLGVAGLASERLLQKHQTVPQQQQQRQPERNTGTAVVIDAEVSDEPTISTTVVAADDGATTATGNADASTTLALAAATVVRGIKARRKALIAAEDRQLKRLCSLLAGGAVKAPGKIGKSLRSLWRLGGGRRTVALTLSIAMAIFVLVRPIAEGLIRESLLDA